MRRVQITALYVGDPTPQLVSNSILTCLDSVKFGSNCRIPSHFEAIPRKKVATWLRGNMANR